MKRLIISAMFVMIAAAASAQTIFPEFPLRGQTSSAQRAYLGVGDGQFSVADVKGEYVVIQAFSMYCPICQRDAPRVNEAYQMIQKQGLGDKVKFLGVGVGNTAFEVVFYARKYEVPFPLFMDDDFSVNDLLQVSGTPTYYVVKLDNGRPVTVGSRVGELDEPGDLVTLIKESMNPEKGAS